MNSLPCEVLLFNSRGKTFLTSDTTNTDDVRAIKNRKSEKERNKTFEPPRGKTNNVVSEQVRHKPTCTSTEAGWKLEILELSIRVAKTKALISFAVTTKLICVFVFAYAVCLFSHEAAHLFSKQFFFTALGLNYTIVFSIQNFFCTCNCHKATFLHYLHI